MSDLKNTFEEKLNELVGGKFKLVANLPYYVTSPIITRFVKNENLESLTVMVQEEVADRIIAKPKTKSYGVLSIICQIFGAPEKAIYVDRKMFTPVPNVDSAVVKIDRISRYKLVNYDKFINFIKKAFAMRRKKLSTNLDSHHTPKNEVEKILKINGFSDMARAEELSIDDFIKLYEILYDKIS